MTRPVVGLALLVVVAIGLAPPGLAPGTAHADDGEELLPSFGIRPVSGGAVDPNTGTFFYYVLSPGSTVRDEALVLNLGDETLALTLYPADGVTAVNGAVTFTAAGEDHSGVRHWLSSGVLEVRLKPGESVTVPFTLRMPADIAAGDWVAGWVVEAPPKAAENALGVDVIERAGVAVVIHVPGPSTQALTLDGACFNGEAGSNYFQVTVTNPGNVLSRGTGTFTLSTEGDEIVFERPADLGAVIPGDETFLRIDAPFEPSPGEYVATTVLRQPNGQEVVSSSSAKIEGTDGNGCAAVAVAGEEKQPEPVLPGLPGGGFPWLILLIALLAALLIAILAAREYLRRRAQSGTPPAP